MIHQAGAHLISKSGNENAQLKLKDDINDKVSSAHSVSVSNVDEDSSDSFNLGKVADTGLVNNLGLSTPKKD